MAAWPWRVSSSAIHSLRMRALARWTSALVAGSFSKRSVSSWMAATGFFEIVPGCFGEDPQDAGVSVADKVGADGPQELSLFPEPPVEPGARPTAQEVRRHVQRDDVGIGEARRVKAAGDISLLDGPFEDDGRRGFPKGTRCRVVWFHAPPGDLPKAASIVLRIFCSEKSPAQAMIMREAV